MKRYRWDAIIDRIDKTGPVIIAEIGVWKGGLSRKLLEALPLLKLIQVDRWKAYSEGEKISEGNSRMSRYGQIRFDNARTENFEKILPFVKRVITYEGDSVVAANRIDNKSLDLVFIDAGHRYAAVISDIQAWLPKIKKGGWISGHDYLRPGVNTAVKEIFNGNHIKTDSNKTWFVRV